MRIAHISSRVVLLLVVGWLGCADEESRLAEHMKRAEAYLEEEKAAEAVIEYRNALRIAPNNAEAHYGLAKAYLASEELGKAYWELQETVRLDPSNLEARLDYTRFLLIGGEEELNQALEQADAVLEQDPRNADAHALKAQALERLQRFDEALEAYETAVTLAPEEPRFLQLLAAYHVRRDHPQEAESHLRRLVEIDPGFRSYAALGAFLARDPAREREAESAYLESLKRAEDEERGLAHRMVASFYIGRGRYEDAERILQQGVEAIEDDFDVRLMLARLYHVQDRKDEADAVMEEAARSKPDDPEPYLMLSAYRQQNGDLQGALSATEAALEVAPEDTRSRLRKAELLIEIGYREEKEDLRAEGQRMVSEVLEEEPSHPEANFVQAKVDLAEKRVDDAIAALRRTVDGRPDWAQAHFLLASALLVDGQRQQARAEAQRALELNAQLIDARRLLARVHADLGDHELATEEARKVLRQDPSDAKARILLAQSLVRLGKADEALEELEQLPAEEQDAEAHYARGRILQLQGRLAQAREAFERALAEQPTTPDILEALLQLDAREGKLAESIERIQKARREEPQDARLARLLGTAFFFAGRLDDAERELRAAIELAPDQLESYQALAQLLVRRGRLDESLEAYRQALNARPNSPEVRLTLGSLYELKGDVDAAIEQYEAAIRLNPNLAVAKNNLAYLMAERGENLDRALDLAQEAKRLLPDNPNTADTLGWVLYKKGLPEPAISYLKEAEGGLEPWRPELGLVRHHLALAYVADGQPEEARRVLERALADLDRARDAAEKRGAKPPPEPQWAEEVRAMLEDLRAQAGRSAGEG